MSSIDEIFAKVDFLDDILETLHHNGEHLGMETILEMIKAASLAASEAQVGLHKALKKEQIQKRFQASDQKEIDDLAKQPSKEEEAMKKWGHESPLEIYENGYRDGVEAALQKLRDLIVDPATVEPMSTAESCSFYAKRQGQLDAEYAIKQLLEEEVE